MIVHITAEAARDLEEIGDHIARDNPERTLSFVIELRSKCLTLADMPYRFPLVPRYERHDIRRRLHGNYLIFYRIEGERVFIVHVLHGAKDYAAVLFEGEDQPPHP